MTREEALKVLRRRSGWNLSIRDANALDMAIKALEQEPEIIRCKDCKQFRRWVDTDITFCDLTESPIFETDFCSRAERK